MKMFLILIGLFCLFSCTPHTVQFTYVLPPLTPEQERLPIPVIETGGHTGIIHNLSFTGNGKFLVSASEDKTIRIWDVETGELAREIRGKIRRGYEGRILAAALASDHETLAVGGYMSSFTGDNSVDMGAIRIFDIKTGELLFLLKKEQGPVMALAYSDDGAKLLSYQPGMRSYVWDVAKREMDFKIMNSNAPALSSVEMTRRMMDGKARYWTSEEVGNTVAISPDSAVAAIGYLNKPYLKLWWLKRRPPYIYDSPLYRKILPGHNGGVYSAKFTPSGKYLVTGSGNGVVLLWDGWDGKFIKVLAKQNNAVEGLSITPDSTKAVAGCGSACNIYGIPSGKRIATFSEHTAKVTATTISSDGKFVASSAAGDNEIYIWDLRMQKVRQRLVGKGRCIWGVGFAKDGRSIAWGKGYQGKGIFKFNRLEQSFRLKTDHTGFDLALAERLQDDTSYLRGIESVGSVKIRTATGRPHRTFQIIKNKRVVHNISRDRSNGFVHNCMTLTHDGETLISGGGEGFLISYDPKTGKKIHDFTGHTADVRAVAISPDNLLLVSGSADQTVRLWHIPTGRLLLTIFQGADNEWVAWTPEGYYNSSPLGDKYIGWHLNKREDEAADFYSAFQFERILYRPDYVNAYLERRGDSKQLNSILRGDYFDINKLRTIAPPKIEIDTPSYGDVFTQETHIPLRISAKSNSLKMLNYAVFVNNIPVTASADRELTSIQQHSFEREVKIPLFGKKNRIRIEVFNGKSMGLAETTVFRKAAVKRRIRGTLYCLSIGVNHFVNMPDNDLLYAAQDADAVEKYFQAQGGKHFDRVVTKSVSDFTDNKPSKVNVIASLEFLKNARAEDTVILFLASHGLSDRAGNYYFVPRNALADEINKLTDSKRGSIHNANRDLSSLISWEAFFNTLRAVPGKRLLIVDTCQAKSISGTFDLHSLAKRSASSSFALLAASKGNEKSQEYPKGKHGLFTYALLKGLSGEGDRNQDGQIVLYELHRFIEHFVEQNRSGLHKQTPQLVVPTELKDLFLAAS